MADPISMGGHTSGISFGKSNGAKKSAAGAYMAHVNMDTPIWKAKQHNVHNVTLSNGHPNSIMNC